MASLDDFVEHYPNKDDICTVALRLQLSTEEWMWQDWQWIVSDPERIDEFVAAYRREPFSDKQKYLLMQIILDSCNDAGQVFYQSALWQQVLDLARADFALHGYTVCYFSSPDAENEDEMWNIAPFMRELLESRRR